MKKIFPGADGVCVALALFCSGQLIASAATDDNEAILKRNAAEQAAALNQDPGGADKKALLEERRNRPIVAGIAGQRNAHPDAQWFGDASLGLFLHWGISSAHGGIDLSWPMVTNMGTGLKIKPAEYWKLAEQFKAEHYDPNLWLAAAKDAGFDYAVLTAKHHDGYTLWPTEASEIGVRTSLPGRDLVKEYVAACRTNGLKVGFYFSGPDWFKDRNYRSFNYRSEGGGNSSLPPIPGRPDLDMDWQPMKLQKMPDDVRAKIQRENRQELTELLTRYGKIDVLWFDGGTGSDITLEEIRKLQPGIVINNRGAMPVTKGGPKFEGDYFTVEHGEQPFRPPGWWEQLRVWNSTWGYMQRDEKRYAPAAVILRSLARSKMWGGSVLANCGPRPDGAMPPPFYQGMAEVRDWMKANGESIKGASPMPETAQANVPVTTRGDIWYLHAVNGSKGKISVTPGGAMKSVSSVRVLRTGEPVKYQWDKGTLALDYPEPDRTTPHEVIAVTFQADANSAEPAQPPLPSYRLVWSDEFDGGMLDTNKWHYRTGKRVLSFQQPENVSVTNGLLRLALKKEIAGGAQYTAGGVISREQFKYGYYEARFRCPNAAGWHTSFWTMDYADPVTLPPGADFAQLVEQGRATNTTQVKAQEIDICEQDAVNPRSYSAGVIDWTGQTGKRTAGFGRKYYRDTADFSANFHVWGCEFTPATVKFYLDGKLTHETDAQKFPHGPQSIWLTCVAALWGDPVKPKAVADAKLPAWAEFDWVRFYEK